MYTRYMTHNDIYIYGAHALEEALQFAPKTIKKIFFEEGYSEGNIVGLSKKLGIQQASFAKGKLPKEIVGTFDAKVVHQGVIALVSPQDLMKEYKKFAEHVEATPDTCIVILAEVQDPQNVGAVIRSAAAFGVTAILIPEHNQAQVTGTVIKVSAGMAFRIPLVTVPNVNNAVRGLKDRGFWIYGLDGSAERSLSQETFDAPAVFILGNEATGIRQKTLELCDIPLSISMNTQCESLNAAASAAVALYAWSVQHPKALK